MVKLRIEKSLLEEMLVQTSITTRNKPVFDPVLYTIKPTGIEVSITDQAKTVGVVAKYSRELFDVYEVNNVNEYQISAFNLLKAVKRFARVKPYLTISFTDEEVVLETEGLKIVDTLRAQEITKIDKYVTFNNLPVPAEPYAVYEVEITELRDLDVKDVIKFIFGNDLRVEGIFGSTLKVAKNLTIKPVKKPEKPITAEYNATMVNRMARAFKGKGIIAVIGSPEEVGPIVMGTVTDKYVLSYWLVPLVG